MSAFCFPVRPEDANIPSPTSISGGGSSWCLPTAAWRFFPISMARSVYPYPIGDGDRRAVIEEILLDAKQRGIPCRIVSMTAADQAELQGWFPGKFLHRTDRDSFDYVYSVDDLGRPEGSEIPEKTEPRQSASGQSIPSLNCKI